MSAQDQRRIFLATQSDLSDRIQTRLRHKGDDYMPTEILAVIPPELENAVAKTGLNPDGAQSLRTAFAPHFVQFHALATEAQSIAVNAPKAARAMRLQLRALRVSADKTRKELKEDSLRRGKAIDGINALLEYQLVPIETAMDKIEKAEEIALAEKKAALKAEREALLAPYVQDVSVYLVADMVPEAFSLFLDSQKSAHAAKIAAEAKAEAERIEREKAEAAERERIRLENEKLKREAIEREEAQRKERLRMQALAEVERQKAAAERAVLEQKAKAEREAAESAARLERGKREKIEAELRQKAAAEQARIAAEKAAAKKAAAAPDKKKIEAFADMISRSAPGLSTESAALQKTIDAQVDKFAAWLKSEAGKL